MPKGKSKTQRPRFKRFKKFKLTRRSDIVTGNMQLINATKIGGKAPIPRRYMCKLRYTDVYALTGSGVRISMDQVFRLNSCYDIDYTGGGHQPRFFDEMSVLYLNHRVIGAKIKLSVIPTDSTLANQNIWIGLLANNSNTSLTGQSYADIAERPFSKTKQGNLYVGAGQFTLSSQHKTANVLGVKSVMYGEEYAGSTTLNPTKQANYHVIAGSLDGGTGWQCRVKVDIEQIVVFENQDTPSMS